MADTVETSFSSVTLGSQNDACEQLVRSNLGNLGRSADGRTVVYRSLDLEGHSLCDISPVRRYGYLERLNISCNNITDLSVLDHLPFLAELNASQNNISELLSGKPLPALRVADFSSNQIEEMGDLSGHRALRNLNLSHNTIQQIRGVSALRMLTVLNLANNQVMRIEHLDSLPLTHLNLSGNMIAAIENIGSLKQLQVLDLSNNQIRGLQGLEGHPVLHTLDLHGNQVSDLSEVCHLLDLHLLQSLDLRQNPLQSKGQYRQFVLHQLPWVVALDRERVTPQEKVTARNKFSPSMDLVSAQRHMYHVTRSLQQPVRLKFSTLTHPNEPYPMLVLCGPLGAGKGYMARRLVEDFPTYFGLGISHTTRPKREEEEQDGREYYFIDSETFSAAEEAGDFLQSQERHGNHYGLSAAAVEMVAQHGLACVVHMGIEGTLEMKNTHFEPRYVLTVPVTPKSHIQRLHRRGCFSEEEIVGALHEAEVCRAVNRDRPGFFDAIVNCDFLDDGYRALRDLVMDYAGITPNSLIQSTDSIAPSALQHPRMSAREYELLGAVDESMHTFSGDTTTRSSSSQQHNAETTTVEETTTTADTSAVSSNVQQETAKLLSQYKEVPHGQAPPPIRSIQSVARSWSRPSTSTSHQSTSAAGSSKIQNTANIGHRTQRKAVEAVCRTRTVRTTHSSPPSLKDQNGRASRSIHTPQPEKCLFGEGSAAEDVGAEEEEEEEEEGSILTDSIGSGTAFSRASTGSGFTPSHTPSPS